MDMAIAQETAKAMLDEQHNHVRETGSTSDVMHTKQKVWVPDDTFNHPPVAQKSVGRPFPRHLTQLIL